MTYERLRMLDDLLAEYERDRLSRKSGMGLSEAIYRVRAAVVRAQARAVHERREHLRREALRRFALNAALPLPFPRGNVTVRLPR